MRKSIQFGMLSGIIGVVIFVIWFLLDPLGPIRWKMTAISVKWGVPMLFMVLAAVYYRQKNSNVLPYGKAVILTSVVILISVFLVYLSDIVIYTIVKPDFFTEHKDALIELQKESLGFFSGMMNVSESELMELESELELKYEERIDQIAAQLQSFIGIIHGSITHVIIAIFLALIISLFVKKKPKSA